MHSNASKTRKNIINRDNTHNTSLQTNKLKTLVQEHNNWNLNKKIKTSLACEDMPVVKALNITDHIIHSRHSSNVPDGAHPALFLTYTSHHSKEELKKLCKEIEQCMLQIDNKKIEHPNSKKKVWDLIHPSRYPFVEGMSRDMNNRIFEIPQNLISYNKKRKNHFYLSRYEMVKSTYRWIPTIFRVTDSPTRQFEEYYIEQKSYINDLFIENLKLKQEIETVILKAFGVCFLLFEELYNMMGSHDTLKNKDLQVMVKSAYYLLKPGQSHEGVWHVEGMPDEHIIMTSIMYYQDDFAESFLEMRRDVSEDEAFERTFVLPQNAIVDEEDKLLVRHLTYLQTRTYSAYAWPNSCQHKLLPLKNTSNKMKKRSFLAFFLVDPNVKIPDTSMIKPQNEYIGEKTLNLNMHNLMEERKKIKVKLNENLEEEISYCEH